MAKTTQVVTAVEDTTRRLSELQTREEQLRTTLRDCDAREPEIKREVTKCDKAIESATFRGLYPAPEAASERLRVAQGELAALFVRRESAAKELAELPKTRLDVLRENLDALWNEYLRARQAQLSLSLDVPTKVEPLVKRYVEAAERAEATKANVERAFKLAGPASARLIDDLRRRNPEPRVENAPDARQATRRAERLRRLFAEDLRFPA